MKLELQKMKPRLPQVTKGNKTHKSKKDYKRVKRQALKKILEKE